MAILVVAGIYKSSITRLYFDLLDILFPDSSYTDEDFCDSNSLISLWYLPIDSKISPPEFNAALSFALFSSTFEQVGGYSSILGV